MSNKKKKSSEKTAKSKAVKKCAKRSRKKLASVKQSKSSSAAKRGNRAKAAKTATKAPPKHLSAEMLRLRIRLSQMLSDLRNNIDHEVRGASERNLSYTNDTFDMASDSAAGDLALHLAESETVEASEIKHAIEKIDNGTYGLCEICDKVIGNERLQFRPFATQCIKCQEISEIRKRAKETVESDDFGSEGIEDVEDLEDLEDKEES